MIRTSKKELKSIIRKQYLTMIAESLEKQELSELGPLKKQRRLPVPPPPPEHAAGGAPEMETMGREMDLGALEDELAGAEWMNADLVPSDTQTQMKTIDIDPGERRPLAKKFGLKESELRALISSIVKEKLG